MNSSQKGFIVPLLIIIIAVVVIGGGAYYYSQKSSTSNPTSAQSSNTKGSDGTFNDSDLRVTVWNDKSADCQAINTLKLSAVADLTSFVTSTSTGKASAAVQASVNKYSNEIATFLNGGSWTTHIDGMGSDGKINCNLSNIRTLSNLSLAKAKILASTGKSNDAQKIITTVLDTSQKMQNNQQTIIGYLVSVSVKDAAIDTLLSLKKQNLINPSSYKDMLNKYADNKAGLKSAFKYEYSVTAQLVDDLTYKNYTPFFRSQISGQVGDTPTVQDTKAADDFIANFEKSRNDFTFQSNNTKALFYNLYKSEYNNVDLPCGSIYTSPMPTFDPKDTTTENYLGKTIFATHAASLNNINNKRCSVEAKFSQF